MASTATKPNAQHSLTPHLVCADAAKAIEFYKRAFGAVEIMRMAMPDGRLMHASLNIGDSLLMLHDEMPEHGALSPRSLASTPVTIHLNVPDVDAVFARALAAGGTQKMPVADMFWGDRYGVLVDPSGHQWSVATRVKDMTPEEMLAAGAEAMRKGCAEASKDAEAGKPAAPERKAG